MGKKNTNNGLNLKNCPNCRVLLVHKFEGEAELYYCPMCGFKRAARRTDTTVQKRLIL